MSDRRKRLLLALVSLLVAVTTAEIFVRLFVPLRNVGPSFVDYDPDYGRRLKQNASFVSHSEEFSFKFSTNSDRLRSPEWEPGANSILFLGDSFTMGYGVSDGEEFPQRISQRLAADNSPLKIVNAGIGNTGNGHWLKFLKRQASEYNPSVVVMQLSGNDPGDNVRERLFTLGSNGSLVEHAAPPPTAIWKAKQLVESIPLATRSHLVALAKQATLALVRRPNKGESQPKPSTNANKQPDDSELNLLLAIVNQSVQACEDNDWSVLLCSVAMADEHNTRIEQLCREKDIPFVLLPDKRSKPEWYFKIDGHWNAAGHQAVADLLYGEMGVILPQKPQESPD